MSAPPTTSGESHPGGWIACAVYGKLEKHLPSIPASTRKTHWFAFQTRSNAFLLPGGCCFLNAFSFAAPPHVGSPRHGYIHASRSVGSGG